LYRNDAAGLAPSKEFLCKMTEKMQADAPPSRQAGFVRCCLNEYGQTDRLSRIGRGGLQLYWLNLSQKEEPRSARFSFSS
jgi:hypothetical protein